MLRNLRNLSVVMGSFTALACSDNSTQSDQRFTHISNPSSTSDQWQYDCPGATSGPPEQVTELLPSGSPHAAVGFSKHGSKLLQLRDVEDGKTEVLELSLTQPNEITHLATVDNVHAFVAGEEVAYAEVDSKVFKIKLDGSGIEEFPIQTVPIRYGMFGDDFGLYYVRWTTLDSKLCTGGGVEFQINEIDGDTGAETMLAGEFCWPPTLIPHGQHLYYEHNAEIWRVDRSDGRKAKVAVIPDYTSYTLSNGWLYLLRQRDDDQGSRFTRINLASQVEETLRVDCEAWLGGNLIPTKEGVVFPDWLDRGYVFFRSSDGTSRLVEVPDSADVQQVESLDNALILTSDDGSITRVDP